ncbi:MAG TPA: NAD(P)-dependent oxidoreductase [Gemmatimonadaceae bacterium]|nr:NAD(P)-dependent oxidoreductase [Gemmatimonadaceae bacterium]
MKVLVTGGTGAIGKFLLPLLVENKHEVTALTRSVIKAAQLEDTGVSAAVVDPFDKPRLVAEVRRAEPEVIIHQLTALSGVGNFRKFDQEFTLTNRFRTEVTDTLLAAARSIGTRRFIAQSYCGWPYAKKGGPIKTEEDPLDPKPPESFTKTLAAIRYLEDTLGKTTFLEAVALRYGMFYGPGTAIGKGGAILNMVKKRRFPVIGGGGGVWSFIHVLDAARATLAAMSRGAPGIYNVVDDEPAKVSIWLPALAKAVEAKPPFKIPHWLGELTIGKAGMPIMTQIRGCSNEKAKRELNWTPIYPSWRIGFVDGLE